MPEDPSLNVGERSVVKMDEEQKIKDKHDQSILSHCCVSAFNKVISPLLPNQQDAIREIGFESKVC